MADDEIVTLDTGEQVRVQESGDQVLIPGPDPEIADIEARRAEQEAKLEVLRQAKRDAIAAKRELEASDPPVPPEKRIF